MARLAWFTPLAPVRSGIATYSAEILPELAGRHDIDVFVRSASEKRGAAELRPDDAHDFLWKHRARPYDLVVYQLGNAACHDYMWPYLVRYPGLTVLHDGSLHHARAATLITHGRHEDYRRELAFCHPGAPRDLPEYAITGFGGPLYYRWPMRRIVMLASRHVAVHSGWLAHDLREAQAGGNGAPVSVIAMGVGDPLGGVSRRDEMRARLRLPDHAVLCAAFGLVTPEKRVPQVLSVLALLARSDPDIHLLLVGDRATHFDLDAEIARHGLLNRVTVAGHVPDGEMSAFQEAADICFCLRWPTSGETSASWLRCLAAGRATLITDLAHTVDVPALDPRTWTLAHAPAVGEPPRPEPVAIAIDIVDEDHSLRLALTRLSRDAALRESLGRAAREWWRSRHTIDRMARDYAAAIASALADTGRTARTVRAGVEAAGAPDHLLDDGAGQARAIAARCGVTLDWSRGFS